MEPQSEFDLDGLNQRIDSVASNRLSLISEYKRLDDRRREIRKEIRNLTEKINQDRKSLDDYYARLSEFKAKRKELLAKIREKKSESEVIEKNLKAFEKRVPKGAEALEKKVQRIEWRLQAERLSREEEKELMNERRALEVKMKAYNKVRSTKQQLASVLGEIKSLKAKLDEMNKFKAENDPEVKAKHERVASMLSSRHELFNEIEQIDSRLAEIDSNISKLTQELDSLKAQRRAAVEGRKTREHEISRARTRELLERAKDDARKKLEQGEKLSFDELKLVFGDGM
jgi:uncharacterized coiled-coil DUF342 family protein